jgi:parallel beta-helix repeat protein
VKPQGKKTKEGPMKHIVFLISYVILLILTPDKLALGAERYVSSQGTDSVGQGENDCLDREIPCKTISQAIKRANPRDTILVFAGKYKECGMVIDKILNIRAATPSSVTIDTSPTDLDDCTEGVVFKFTKNSAGSSLEGFKITATVKENDNTAVIWLNEVSNISILRNTIELKRTASEPPINNEVGTVIKLSDSFTNIIANNALIGEMRAVQVGDKSEQIGTKRGIHIERGSQNILEGNRIAQFEYNILITNSLVSELLYNHIENARGIGVSIKDFLEFRLEGNAIIKNTSHGISVEGPCKGEGQLCQRIKITKNRVTDNQESGIFLYRLQAVQPIQLLENNIENNKQYGIRIVQSSNLSLESNVINNNALEGISLVGLCGSIQVIKNRLMSNKRSGILFEAEGDFQDVTLKENTIQNNGAGITLGESLYVNFKFLNNAVERNTNAGLSIEGLKEKSDVEIEGNTFSFQTGGYGMVIQAKADTKVTVTKNIMNSNAKSGLLFEGAQSQTIQGNTASMNKESGIILIQGNKNTIFANTTDGNQQDGIKLEDSNENKIEANQSQGNSQHGLHLMNSSSTTVVGNILVSNRCTGLVINGSADNTIEANTITSNGISCPNDLAGPFQLKVAGIYMTNNSRKNTFRKNTIDRNLNGLSIDLLESAIDNVFQCNQIINNKRGIQLLAVGKDSISFTKNNIARNEDLGLRNFTTIKVSAQNNWWGHSSGPWHENNTSGKGDRILGPVEFEPWLRQAVDVSRCP